MAVIAHSRFMPAWRRLDSAATARLACWLMPLLFGLLSVLLGQDDNWDLHNYHLYNPFALLHGKIGLDLAPGQWQSYFNPTLDLLYYGLVTQLPAPLTSFIMGALHGLHFPLLVGIGRCLLPPCADGRPAYRASLLLALAGCMGPAFLSELGNSMGDNLSGLFVLAALLVLLRRGPVNLAACLFAGVLAGLGTGLKLTNASYAVGLCLALLACGGGWRARLGAAWCFGIGVLAGIAVSAGHWFWRMWTMFGNPLFPQFNDKFHAPLAAPIGVGDTGWLPKNWIERLEWPLLTVWHPQRISELPLRDLLWPMIYAAVLALAGATLLAAWRGRRVPVAAAPLTPGGRLLLAFFAVSYLVWLGLFSIYRYLLPLELLAPLTFWLLTARLAPSPAARRRSGWVLALLVCASLPMAGWGHAGRGVRSFTVQTPALARPEQSMVFTVGANPPQGWLAVFFPDTLAFVSIDAGFPESAAYRARVAAMRRSRQGPLFLMLPDWPVGLPRQSDAERQRRVAANASALAGAAASAGKYGLRLDPAGCQSYPAMIGKTDWSYRLCVVSAAPD